jgi:phosphatidylglycerol:prolipoprotein diacylglycerol transferase
VFLGYVFGRIGCFMNGCCYGGVCEVPWGVHFPHVGDAPGVLRHPAQLYSSLMALGLFAFMQRAKLSPVFNRFPGQLTLLFFALYAVERGVMEIFRAGSTAHTVLGTDWLTQAQVVSIIALIVVAIAWTVMSRRAKGEPALPSSQPLAPHS